MVAVIPFPKDGYPFSASEIGRALAGLIQRESSGLPRVGMLGTGPTVGAVASAWKVKVGPFIYAHQIAGGVTFSGRSAEVQVDILPAAGNIPAGRSRIDVVCWDPVNAEFQVIQGAHAAGNPQAPAIGALAPVMQVRVNAGDGAVVAGQISKAFQVTSLAKGAAPVRLQDAKDVGTSVARGARTVLLERTMTARGRANLEGSIQIHFPPGNAIAGRLRLAVNGVDVITRRWHNLGSASSGWCSVYASADDVDIEAGDKVQLVLTNDTGSAFAVSAEFPDLVTTFYEG